MKLLYPSGMLLTASIIHAVGALPAVQHRSGAATYGNSQVVVYNPSYTCSGASVARTVATAEAVQGKTTLSPCYVTAKPFYSLELHSTSDNIRAHCSIIWYVSNSCQGSSYGLGSAVADRCMDARVSSFGDPPAPARSFLFQCTTS